MGSWCSNSRKNYLASEWNIKKFTNNRFNNIKLNENAPPKVSEKNTQSLNKILIIHKILKIKIF